MNEQVLHTFEKRRSRYKLSKESTLNKEELYTLLERVLQTTPSAFHSQAGKIVLLLNEQHDLFWNIVKDSLRKKVSTEQFIKTEQKINGLQHSYGTILFFEDMAVMEQLQQKFPSYKSAFDIWSNEQSGMLQFAVWVALANNNMGASLQHYNPVIDEAVTKAFSLPAKWKLMAQMPFGVSLEEPAPKEKAPTKERLIVLD
jgi:predicted oxidoreductase (fatty acid repression mutant protein)